MDSIYVFTDASFITSKQKKNKLKRNVGVAAVIFNKDKKAIKCAAEVPSCQGSTQAEMFAINTAIMELLSHFSVAELQTRSITIHSDCKGAIDFIMNGPGRRSRKTRPEVRSLVDMAEVIRTIILEWDLNVEFRHVHGHRKESRHDVTVLHKFNNECNAIALSTARKLANKTICNVSEVVVKLRH